MSPVITVEEITSIERTDNVSFQLATLTNGKIVLIHFSKLKVGDKVAHFHSGFWMETDIIDKETVTYFEQKNIADKACLNTGSFKYTDIVSDGFVVPINDMDWYFEKKYRESLEGEWFQMEFRTYRCSFFPVGYRFGNCEELDLKRFNPA